jgi:hypothetical protein
VRDETYEQRRDREREEKHTYEMDAMYEVWRAGGNTDRINYERVDDHYSNGDSYETAARDELRRQRPPPPDEQEQQQYPEQQYPEQ